MKKLFVFGTAALLSLAVLSGCGTTRQTPQEKSEAQAQTARRIQQMLDERAFDIDIIYMMPLRGSSRAVTGYSITVNGSTIDSHLPYQGQARNVPYGGGKGLTFKEEIESYTDSGLKKDSRSIVITVKNEEDNYVYNLEIFDNGEASLHVRARNRDSISYRGRMNLDYKKDEVQ